MATIYRDTPGQILRVTIAAIYPLLDNGPQVQETNVWYLCTAASGGTDTRGDLGNAVYNRFNVAMLPVMSVNTKLYGWKVSAVNIHPPPLAISTVTNDPGTDAVLKPLPTQARGLIRNATTAGGRSGRGRQYLFTPGSDQLGANGSPSAAYQAALSLLAANLTGPFTFGASVWIQAVAHRPKPPATLWTADGVTANTNLPTWCTQRRSGESGRINVNPW